MRQAVPERANSAHEFSVPNAQIAGTHAPEGPTHAFLAPTISLTQYKATDSVQEKSRKNPVSPLPHVRLRALQPVSPPTLRSPLC